MIDYHRLQSGKMPIFMIRITSTSKSTLHYIGLGYRMERKIGVSYKQPIYADDYVKFGTWLYISKVNIDKDIALELRTINNKIMDYFAGDQVELKENLSFHYIDEKAQAVIVGLIHNTKQDQDKFKKLVVDSDLIQFVQGENVNLSNKK